jgi:hypothetical protein
MDTREKNHSLFLEEQSCNETIWSSNGVTLNALLLFVLRGTKPRHCRIFQFVATDTAINVVAIVVVTIDKLAFALRRARGTTTTNHELRPSSSSRSLAAFGLPLLPPLSYLPNFVLTYELYYLPTYLILPA